MCPALLLTFPVSHGRLWHNPLALVARSLSCHSDRICPFSISSLYSDLYLIYCVHFVCPLSNWSILELCFLFLLGLLLKSMFSLMLNSISYTFSCELFLSVIFFQNSCFLQKHLAMNCTERNYPLIPNQSLEPH